MSLPGSPCLALIIHCTDSGLLFHLLPTVGCLSLLLLAVSVVLYLNLIHDNLRELPAQAGYISMS